MTSEKQLIANQKNAQLSTGPKTSSGKEAVVTNAIKHGIFTKDLFISGTLGNEKEDEYLEVYNNLIVCLSPQNQMESLLVEKISIDFWRLRRVIRFETGNIGKYLQEIYKAFYSYGKQNNIEIETEIQRTRETIEWITTYLKCLKKEKVSFDNPIWEDTEIESDILDDFRLIIKSLQSIPYQEKEELLYGKSDFNQFKAILSQNGYSSKKELSIKLIEIYTIEIQKLEKEIKEAEKRQLLNTEADRLNDMVGMISQEDSTEKILKYERSIQKSIFQNLFLLKKLQESNLRVLPKR